MAKQIQKRLTLTPQEALILQEVCERFGWSKSKALQIMFIEWCDKRQLLFPTGPPTQTH